MADDKRSIAKPSGASDDVAAFLAEAEALGPAGEGRGRLIFALDATMSRQPTWDRALNLQGQMFEEAAKVGTLDIQLVYFRGFGECRASRWVSETVGLRNLMTGIQCRGGNTQIGKVLNHARKETAKRQVAALVFVGDALEEDLDPLSASAGELGMLGVRMFMFQEGRDAQVERGFRDLAQISGGAYARFDPNAPREFAALLRAAAAYAAGGRKALEQSGTADRLLLTQLK